MLFKRGRPQRRPFYFAAQQITKQNFLAAAARRIPEAILDLLRGSGDRSGRREKQFALQETIFTAGNISSLSFIFL